MKILFLIDSLGTGGAENSMVKLAKFIKSEGHNVTFLCLDRREVSHEMDVIENGIEVIYINKEGFLLQLVFLIKYIKKEQPDIIHSVLFRSDILLRVSRIFSQKIIVVQSLVSTPYSSVRRKDRNVPKFKLILAKQLDIWTARILPSYYHSISKTVFDHYKEIFKIKRNYRIIYRGRCENKHVPQKDDSQFLLMNVGRQEFAKGQIDILKALKHLYDNLLTSELRNVKIQILGFEGKSSKNLIEFIKENDLQNEVEIIGYVNNVEQRIVNADVFLFPSYYEGLGGSLIEAFAAKLPCICSDIPVLREVVGNEKGALFCKPGDYVDLANKIFELYRDKDLRNSLKNYSFTRFKNSFEIDTIHFEMLEMYKDLYLEKPSNKLLRN